MTVFMLLAGLWLVGVCLFYFIMNLLIGVFGKSIVFFLLGAGIAFIIGSLYSYKKEEEKEEEEDAWRWH